MANPLILLFPGCAKGPLPVEERAFSSATAHALTALVLALIVGCALLYTFYTIKPMPIKPLVGIVGCGFLLTLAIGYIHLRTLFGPWVTKSSR